MKSENIFVFGLIGLGLLLLFTTRSPNRLSGRTNFKPVWLTENKPEGRRYRNTETWDIKWNTDGLPEKVTIHRDARQS